MRIDRRYVTAGLDYLDRLKKHGKQDEYKGARDLLEVMINVDACEEGGYYLVRFDDQAGRHIIDIGAPIEEDAAECSVSPQPSEQTAEDGDSCEKLRQKVLQKLLEDAEKEAAQIPPPGFERVPDPWELEEIAAEEDDEEG